MFEGLVVLEIANNHQGDVGHGKRLIDAFHREVLDQGDWRFAVKFQFRDLDTFIHPKANNKHTKRFRETELTQTQYGELIQHARDKGFLIVVTPFDEISVKRLDDFKVDYCKVASCSNKDWPLLREIAKQNRPIIISTGGADVESIDNLNSFFEHNGKEFAFNHCMAIYPTPPIHARIAWITLLKDRYKKTVGWSTHEHCLETDGVIAAYSAGARMFECHVGIYTRKYGINAYSKKPKGFRAWFVALKKARDLYGCDEPNPWPPFCGRRWEESAELHELRRAEFVRSDGSTFLAFPASMKGAFPIEQTKPHPLKAAIHRLKSCLSDAGVSLPPSFETEFSHHYGIDRFEETGVTMFTIVNRDYAKKILVMLPGQRHPSHYHKRKEETFHILHGDLNVVLDGREFAFRAGQTLLVQAGVWHSFWSESGCVFEEISTTAYKEDSVYADSSIAENQNRKTTVSHWGRWELC